MHRHFGKAQTELYKSFHRAGGLGKAHDRTETPRDPRRQQIPEPASPPPHNLAGVALSLGAERVLPLT